MKSIGHAFTRGRIRFALGAAALCLFALASARPAERPEGSRANAAARVSSAPAFGAVAADLSDAIAYPVPFRRSTAQKITFLNLSTEATIRIYTLSGELVKTLHETDGDGILKWDVTAEDGTPLGSDVFLYVIENAQQKKTGKLLIEK